MTSRKRRKSSERVEPAEGQVCPSCGLAILSDARFCHSCGATLDGGPGGGKRSVRMLAGVGAVAALVIVGVIAAAVLFKRDGAPSSSPALPTSRFNAPFMASPDGPQTTPREAADRLFNRIMMASEQGKRTEALGFVPMAVQAYEALPALDRDAHYHLGLIHGVAGDRGNVEKQIAALRQSAPNHLLALMLEHDNAEQAGDKTAVSRLLAAFVAAYDAEMATGRPEYEGHRGMIEKFRAVAALRAAP